MKHVTIDGIEYEALSTFDKVFKRAFINPLVNYVLPRGLLRKMLHTSKSPILRASLDEPGGWQSMRAAYEEDKPQGTIDALTSKYGSLPMGLRNRKKLAVKTICRLLAETDDDQELVAIGEGAGDNVIESMAKCANRHVRALCIDLNSEAFTRGEHLAERYGLTGRVRFVHGKAQEVATLCDCRPHVVTNIGIIEYLKDEEVVSIFRAMHNVMPAGGAVLANSLEKTHGVDRFLRTVLGLHLIYRASEEVKRLMTEGGFGQFAVEREPMGIYSIVVGRKPGG